jgi:hypothetical protein
VEGEAEKPAPGYNYRRRVIGVVICFAPVALVVVSLAVGQVRPRQSGLGVALSVVGLLVGGLNMYLAAVRPAVYRWRCRSMDGYRNVSGLPGLGTLVVVAGGSIGFCDWRAAALGLLALAVDLCGLPWFLLATWRDRSFWDVPVPSSPVLPRRPRR